jgi:predicted RNA-binding Zn ribbon-like protein
MRNLRKFVERGLNDALRWLSNRATGGYLARIDTRTEEMVADSKASRRLLGALHDRFQNEALVALLLERMSGRDAVDAGWAREGAADTAQAVALLEENRRLLRLLHDRLENATLAAVLLERLEGPDTAPPTATQSSANGDGTQAEV